MKTRKDVTLAEPDMNDPAVKAEVEQAHLEYAAFTLPTDVLKSELQKRGFIVEDNTHYDEATGLLKWNGEPDYFFSTDTRHMVSNEEAYKRASGGW